MHGGDIGDQPFLDWDLQADFSVRDYFRPDKLRAGGEKALAFIHQYWQKLAFASVLLFVVGVGGASLSGANLSTPEQKQPQVQSATDMSNDIPSTAPSVVAQSPAKIQSDAVGLGATAITPVSVGDDYKLGLPSDERTFGWYARSGELGASGSSVVLNSGPGYAEQLRALSDGDVVTLTGQGTSVNYRVTSTTTAKDYNFLLSDALEPTTPGQGGLTIVLYHGQSGDSGSYPDRLVISAVTVAE